MLHVFYGNSTSGVRQKAYAFLAPHEVQGVKLSRIDSDTYQPGILADTAGSVSLFGDTTAYIIDTPSASSEMYEEVVAALPELEASHNLFVIIEGTLLAAAKKIFSKHAQSTEEVKEDKGRPFNVFALADSLSRKDKKSLWLGLCEAKQAGLSAEEIIGTLWWQLKTLRVAAQTKTASEAGMKDFPYSKAKRSLTHFKEGELEKISQSLLALYHGGHMGETDIDLSLEKWTLSI